MFLHVMCDFCIKLDLPCVCIYTFTALLVTMETSTVTTTDVVCDI